MQQRKRAGGQASGLPYNAIFFFFFFLKLYVSPFPIHIHVTSISSFQPWHAVWDKIIHGPAYSVHRFIIGHSRLYSCSPRMHTDEGLHGTIGRNSSFAVGNFA